LHPFLPYLWEGDSFCFAPMKVLSKSIMTSEPPLILSSTSVGKFAHLSLKITKVSSFSGKGAPSLVMTPKTGSLAHFLRFLLL